MQPVKRAFLVLFLALIPSLARASFVQGGIYSPGGSTSSITCSPNDGSGSVTAGNLIVMGVKINGSSITGISSVRVTTWVNEHTGTAGDVSYWYGIATSSGVETITVSVAASQIYAAVCGEWSSTTSLNVFNSSSATTDSVTTTVAVTQLIVVVGGDNTTSLTNFTLRESAILHTTPNGLILLGDLSESSTGTYTSTASAGAAAQCLGAFYTPVTISSRHRIIEQ